MAPSDCVKLLLDSRVRVAGEIVAGTVEFDEAVALSEEGLFMSLKSILMLAAGSSWPSAAIKDGAYRPHKVILHEETVLWKRDQSSNSQVAHFPFEFRLPDTLPSSFDCGSTGASGTIFYYVEVVANRRGLLNMDRHMRIAFGVFSASTAIEVDSARRLRQGWDGKLLQYVEKKTVRQKLWSHSINVEAELTVPALPSINGVLSLPINAPIPATLAVISYHPRQPAEDAFPPLPSDPSEIKLRLDRLSNLRVRTQEHEVLEHLRDYSGFEKKNAEPTRVSHDGKDEGWKREVQFSTQLILTGFPSTKTETITTRHVLHIVVPFPGVGNNLTWDVLIHVNSGLVSDTAEGASFPAYAGPSPEYLEDESKHPATEPKA